MSDPLSAPTCQWCKDLRDKSVQNKAKWVVTTNSPSPLTAPVCEDHKWADDKIEHTY